MGDEAGSLNHPQWEHLLSWLKDRGATCTPLVIAKKVSPHSGYGLFSLCAAPPSTPLFTIPAAALLNHDSLSPYYPDAHLQLNAFQLVSLHLMLYRPQSDSKCPLDPPFGPYISVLPPNFNLHPLSWFWKDTLGLASPAESRLLRSIPPSVFRSLQDIAKRFQADWIKVLAYMQGCPALQGDCKLAIMRVQQHQSVKMESDFLWAWLNVNTRCIYHRLKPLRSDPDNFTLCPILDFANHSSSKPQTWPKPSNADIWDTSISVKKPKFTLLSPPNVDVQPGEELYLKYGAHSNRFLFIEYGFVNDAQRNISDGDVDLQEDILHLFKQRGALGRWMEERLIEEGYWGDWTIHSSPPPAFPSYRLITTLRLYHLLDAITDPPIDSETGDGILNPWRQVILGRQDFVSEENERRWRDTLSQICGRLAEAAEERISLIAAQSDNGGGGLEYAQHCILSLWKEEYRVTRAVGESLRQGVEF